MKGEVLTHVLPSASPHLSRIEIERLVNDLVDAAEERSEWRFGHSLHGFVETGNYRFLIALDYWVNGYEAWIGLPEEIEFVYHNHEAHDGQNRVRSQKSCQRQLPEDIR